MYPLFHLFPPGQALEGLRISSVNCQAPGRKWVLDSRGFARDPCGSQCLPSSSSKISSAAYIQRSPSAPPDGHLGNCTPILGMDSLGPCRCQTSQIVAPSPSFQSETPAEQAGAGASAEPQPAPTPSRASHLSSGPGSGLCLSWGGVLHP